jgi:hypothetical protein
MAEVTKGVTNPSISTPWPAKENLLTGLLTGENIAQGDACYINAAGAVMRASGASANAAAKVFGFALKSSDNGEAITLARGVNIGYSPLVGGSPVAPGTDLFLSGTVAGGLADAASTGGTTRIAVVIDTDGRILALGNYS